MHKKCEHRDGAVVQIGDFAVDPCVYKREEGYRNVDVIISRCVYCGALEISWKRTAFTEAITIEELDDE